MRIQEQLEDLHKLLKTMPIHTENTAKIPRSYSQGMPKNLMDYSAEKMEDFFNPAVSIIEEIGHRQPKSLIPKYFVLYNKKYYSKYHLLKGDQFFGAKLREGLLGNNGFFRFFPTEHHKLLTNYAVPGNTKVLGAELTFGSTNNTATGNHDFLFAGAVTGVIGTIYNQGATKVTTANGNYRMGIYNDVGSVPDTLLGDGGDKTVPSGFTYTAWDADIILTQTAIWIASLFSSSSCSVDYNSGSAIMRRRSGYTYAALPSSFTNNGTTNDLAQKIKGV